MGSQARTLPSWTLRRPCDVHVSASTLLCTRRQSAVSPRKYVYAQLYHVKYGVGQSEFKTTGLDSMSNAIVNTALRAHEKRRPQNPRIWRAAAYTVICTTSASKSSKSTTDLAVLELDISQWRLERCRLLHFTSDLESVCQIFLQGQFRTSRPHQRWRYNTR